jgi:hypothetical protein
MELAHNGSPILPFGEAPAGTTLACNIVIGQALDGSFALEQRIPSGVPFDPCNPVHMFGLFVVQNAQQLMALALEAGAQARARAVQQTDEIIAAASLRGN